MEKSIWRQVRYNDRHGNVPNLRWGHSCCVIDDQVVFFGGYADSNYMNDVWSFNTITMQWSQIETKGDIPSYRSNCSMNYDVQNNRIIVFGGGGANKKRFNSINILDWKTKQWLQINPKQNCPAPWERTYHSAQLFYPYLVIFGGEGIGDLDDLWIFDFRTLDWTQVPIPKNATRPCARRFHSSAKIGNEFFVIAGCHSKYRCLSDIYSIDLTDLVNNGQVNNLHWVDRKMKDSTYLTRWGHTSVAYQDKVYLFGGRFSNDLNDILMIDPVKNQITTYKVVGDIPKARRRHSACFLGNSMLIFGGFNGQYFNDLFYISIATSKRKNYVNLNMDLREVQYLKNNKNIESIVLNSKDGKEMKIVLGLVARRFSSLQPMQQFLRNVNQKLQTYQLKQLINTLYLGYGKIDSSIIYQYGINVYDSLSSYEQDQLFKINQQQKRTTALSKRSRVIEPIVLLDTQDYNQYLSRVIEQQNIYNDVAFLVNNQIVKSNKAILSLKNQYFKILISSQFRQSNQYQKGHVIHIPFSQPQVFQVLINYLVNGFVVVNQYYDTQFWIAMAQMADYFCISDLLSICQNHLITKITQKNCQQMLLISLKINLQYLSKICSQQIIRNMVNYEKDQSHDNFVQIKNQKISMRRQLILKQIYTLLRFDILQKKIEAEQKQSKNFSKKEQNQNLQGALQQKENYQNRF